MKAAFLALCGAIALILVWILLLRPPGLELEDQSPSLQGAQTPLEAEGLAAERSLLPGQDEAPGQLLGEPGAPPEAASTRAGIWVKRSDGSPAVGVRIVFGDALVGRQGEGSFGFAWVVTNEQGFAWIRETELARLLRLHEDGRAIFAAAHFPYPGPTQVLWPLTEEQLLSGQQQLHLRPAGSIEVVLTDAIGESFENEVSLQLSPGPDADRLSLPFVGAGSFGDQRISEDGRVVFPWVGVGLTGVIHASVAEMPATRFRGPLFGGDQEQLELQIQGAFDTNTSWNFQLVDPAGRPIEASDALRWQIDVIRNGVVWHKRTGRLEFKGDPVRSRIELIDRPPLLANDQLSLYLSSPDKTWRPRDISQFAGQGEHELGLFALEPLPLLVAGEIPGLFELGVTEIRFQVQESIGLDLDGHEQWRNLRVLNREELVGTDENARFRIHGEPSQARMRLVVLAGVYFQATTLEFNTGTENLRIELKRRPRVER